MPNHLSTYLAPLLQNKTTPHIFKTTKPLIKEWGKEERSDVGKVEVMRRDEQCGDHTRKGWGEEHTTTESLQKEVDL